jgi:hypothetical protein
MTMPGVDEVSGDDGTGVRTGDVAGKLNGKKKAGRESVLVKYDVAHAAIGRRPDLRSLETGCVIEAVWVPSHLVERDYEMKRGLVGLWAAHQQQPGSQWTVI